MLTKGKIDVASIAVEGIRALGATKGAWKSWGEGERRDVHVFLFLIKGTPVRPRAGSTRPPRMTGRANDPKQLAQGLLMHKLLVFVGEIVST
jgi:hypothetical protein